ncbi:interferon alpha/beta receptor 1b-like isoform X1 [Xiphophorus maculatus]|uniref:Interferon alpha/beta receptor 1b-like n=1 Tax=Xiphophorus maculatus TaxID=8083 RepID=M3ZYX2_XIPMA|nr:interferon alpha/beta receptor 1b-like isoform X1 [Xiphophorus maculatus]
MLALVRLCLLFVCLTGSAAEAELTPPDDLFMLTLNTNYTLAWDWDQSAAGSDSATFTVQYAGNHSLKKRNPKWTTVCAETSGRSCDLTRSGLNYLGLYVVRVQTNLNGRHSVWKSLQFSPDKDAVLGPPSKVRLGVSGRTLDIFITDPQNSSNSSMKEHLNKLSYDIVYWEQPEDGKGSMPDTTSTEANVVTLSSIKPWTRYCIQIRSRDDFYNKTSTFTAPLCAQTEGVVPWWKIFMYFLLSLVSCFLMVLLFLYGGHHCFQICKATFLPNEKLPSYIKQHEGDYPRLIVSDYESDLCDPVIVCPESAILVINPAVDSAAPPAGLDQDRSSRHSRQNSSSSGDSGVYSAGGNSGGLQPKVASTFTDVNPGFDSEKLNMLSMNSEFKVFPAVPDEGVVDMEV